MKKTYEIRGMSCIDCRNHVEKAILNVAGVSDVSVDLDNAEARVESQFEVPLENLQGALKDSGGEYSIRGKNKVE